MPQVIKTTPAAFANDVDPATDKITVTFDRPMRNVDDWWWLNPFTMSPTSVGVPTFDVSRTTAFIGVKMQPGKVYWVELNDLGRVSFRSSNGQAAQHHIILFATRSADGKPTPLPEDLVKRARQINSAAQGSSEAADEALQGKLKTWVENFFSANYRDITARKTLEWGQPETTSGGNLSIRYKYLATIWNKDQMIIEQRFTFTPEGKYVSAETIQKGPASQPVDGQTVAMTSDRPTSSEASQARPASRPAQSVPHVIETTPTVFTDDVDPALDKITVTFDQPMLDQSWSWTGGGDTYPEITGKIHYDQTRTTCTMPVKLQPGKVYWVGVNSPSHKNFKTPDRIPAQRYVILFATRSADGKPTPLPEDLVKRARQINSTGRPAVTGAAATQPVTQRSESQNAVNAAVPVAQAWLALLDEGKIEQSWDQAAKPLQAAISRDKWAAGIESVRQPLGKVTSRKLISATYATSLPGAADGRYVVVQFKTSFDNKQDAVETVTPMLEADGNWRVSGYYIK